MVRHVVAAFRNRWLFAGLAAAGVLSGLAFCPAAASQRVFRAGAAKRNITPPMGALLVGEWVPQPAGYVHRSRSLPRPSWN